MKVGMILERTGVSLACKARLVMHVDLVIPRNVAPKPKKRIERSSERCISLANNRSVEDSARARGTNARDTTKSVSNL